MAPHLVKMAGVWMLGLVPGALYMAFNPDGIAHPDRWSYGPWLWALKYTPYSHVFSFVFGVMLADLDRMIARNGALAAVAGDRRVRRNLRAPEPGTAGAIRDHPRRTADAAVWLHRPGAGGRESAGHALGSAPAGLCGRGQLLPLPAALQPVEPDSRVARAGCAGPEPLRSVDQLCAADCAGGLGAALHREAGAAQAARVDARDERGEKPGTSGQRRDQGSGFHGFKAETHLRRDRMRIVCRRGSAKSPAVRLGSL